MFAWLSQNLAIFCCRSLNHYGFHKQTLPTKSFWQQVSWLIFPDTTKVCSGGGGRQDRCRSTDKTNRPHGVNI